MSETTKDTAWALWARVNDWKRSEISAEILISEIEATLERAKAIGRAGGLEEGFRNGYDRCDREVNTALDVLENELKKGRALMEKLAKLPARAAALREEHDGK